MIIVRSLIAVCAMSVALMSATYTKSQAQDGAGQAVIAIEKAALDKWGHGDPGGLLEVYAPDITYFDEASKHRIDGHAAMVALYKSLIGVIQWKSWEMVDPKVQAYGDVAVLTYRLNSEGTENGTPTSRHWNSTSVYVHGKGGWKMIHSHWGFTALECAK
jgi:ketosteroid isomerase-like protein